MQSEQKTTKTTSHRWGQPLALISRPLFCLINTIVAGFDGGSGEDAEVEWEEQKLKVEDEEQHIA